MVSCEIVVVFFKALPAAASYSRNICYTTCSAWTVYLKIQSADTACVTSSSSDT